MVGRCQKLARRRRSHRMHTLQQQWRTLSAKTRAYAATANTSTHMVVTVYRAIHGTAPRYLWDLLHSSLCWQEVNFGHPLSDFWHLTFVSGHCWRLLILYSGPWLWNCLPEDIQSASSTTIFCQKLKSYLFWQSYSDIIAILDLEISYLRLYKQLFM